MTLKETITRELLEAVGDPTGLEGVFRRHSHSKGPLYAALAEATAQLYECLGQAQEELTKTGARQKELQVQMDSLDSQRQELDQRVKAQEQRLSQDEARLAKVQGLLEEAHELAKLGFGADQLARLRELLLETAVSQGVGGKEAIGFFFQKVGHYQDVACLEVEARKAEVAGQKAKAEAARWQAEAQAAEAKCKARKASINLTEKLLAQGVKEPDLPHWARILVKAGVAPESLGQGLEQYTSLEALVHARQKRAEELKDEVATLQSRVKALTQEREEAHAAIQSVKEAALAEVLQVG